VQSATLARKVQNIIMHPSSQQYWKITAHNLLPHCPVNAADVTAVDDIYGINIELLKGKTVSRPGPAVKDNIKGLPRWALEQHSTVVLCVDIIFINKVAFLVTTSCNIKFGTVENLKN